MTHCETFFLSTGKQDRGCSFLRGSFGGRFAVVLRHEEYSIRQYDIETRDKKKWKWNLSTEHSGPSKDSIPEVMPYRPTSLLQTTGTKSNEWSYGL